MNYIDLWGLENVVVMFSLNTEDKNFNDFFYNILVDQSAKEISQTAKESGKTVRIDRDATEAEIIDAYEDSDTERLIIVAHGSKNGADINDIDKVSITPGDFGSKTPGSDLKDVDIDSCYQDTFEGSWRDKIDATAQGKVIGKVNVNTYNPKNEAIHWNQTNHVLRETIPEIMKGKSKGPLPKANPFTSILGSISDGGNCEN